MSNSGVVWFFLVAIGRMPVYHVDYTSDVKYCAVDPIANVASFIGTEKTRIREQKIETETVSYN